MLESMLERHFVTIFLILGFSMKLMLRKSTRDTQVRFLWNNIICAIILIAADCLDIMTSDNPKLSFLRTLADVTTYSVEPVAAVSIVFVVVPDEERFRRILWVPAMINFGIMFTAFFSPIAFGYDADYQFFRNPLGYSVFVVSFFYIAVVLLLTIKKFHEGLNTAVMILPLCAAACCFAAFLDAMTDGNHVNPTMLISCIFYYMFIRSKDTNRDPLTKLLNRQSFYEDCEKYNLSVSAAASVDMNGLKRLNDSKGHDAGDEALACIAKCLASVARRSIIPYRVGGDEFVVLFLKCTESSVQETLAKIVSSVKAEGYSVSVGYAMRYWGESIDKLVNFADQKMYEDKTAYYERPDFDRRRR